MLGSLTVNGYETKVFVLQSNLQPLSPVVTNVVPGHDQRVTSSPVGIQLQFSDGMDETALKGAFRYDGQAVASTALTWNPSSRTLTCSLPATDGIHTIEVLTNAISSAGMNLFGKFRSRFLVGSDANILVNRTATNDVALINNGVTVATSTNVTLYHKATGAQKFRVCNETGSWSTWQPYTSPSAWSLSPGDGLKSVQVQYWADGSAAYFVNSSIQVQQATSTGVPFWWLQQYGFTGDYEAAALGDQDHDGMLTWQEYIAGTNPTNAASVWVLNARLDQGTNVISWPSISNRLYTLVWSTNVAGPWSPLATDLPPTPPQNSYADGLHSGQPQPITGCP